MEKKELDLQEAMPGPQEPPELDELHRIFTDGSGDGRLAWYNETTKESWSAKTHVSSNNEAEYLAIYNALNSAKTKNIEVLSDSQLVVNQLKREWAIKSDRMRDMFDKVHYIINMRSLEVQFTWVPREKNPAGKYLG